ncbi:MAG: nucleoside-diphosphate kinase [Prevotellaceae bacterium]|jgi:nucleoside-diphosphate kinase|nr:nucleoside-diphosphate kinase [Prevotellaceae bacterium]
MEKTLIIIKPGAVQRGLIGEVLSRFEKKGLQVCGIKMIRFTEESVSEHYAHLSQKPFFNRIKRAMMISPVIVCCLQGVDAVRVVRHLVGATNGREALPGTVRGDFSMSVQENIVHASDSTDSAETELTRFFSPEELFDYDFNNRGFIYANNEF